MRGAVNGPTVWRLIPGRAFDRGNKLCIEAEMLPSNSSRMAHGRRALHLRRISPGRRASPFNHARAWARLRFIGFEVGTSRASDGQPLK